MMKAPRLLAAAVGLMVSTVSVANGRVIYGDDDRRDLFDIKNDPKFVEIAKSTAIVLYTAKLTADQQRQNQFKVPMDTFGSEQDLCPSEPFFSQPAPGFCSGFLVAPDVFVTAGHCIEDAEACEGTSFIFDYGYDRQDKDLSSVSGQNVYQCKSIISRKLDGGRGLDYAIVRLDRPAVDRKPLKIRHTGEILPGEGVTVIGHPSGLPTKITSGAKVRVNDTTEPFFVTNLDTYGGNSGSAVFNTSTGEVEGILVRGETDFVKQNGCLVSNHCAEGACRGEDVTRAANFLQYIPAN